MRDRKKILSDMSGGADEFILQSAILEVLLDNRDLLVEIKDGLAPRRKPLGDLDERNN